MVVEETQETEEEGQDKRKCKAEEGEDQNRHCYVDCKRRGPSKRLC